MGKAKRLPEEIHFDGQVGARLRALRIAKGLSLAELGRKIERSSQMMGRVERGESALPVYRLNLAARALDVNITHILAPPDDAGDDIARWVAQILSRAEVDYDGKAAT